MNTRRALILVPIVAAAVAACSSTNVTSGPTAAKCQVTVGTLANVTASGGIASVTVTAPQECGWDATTQAAWITGFSPASGQGSANLEFQVAPNTASTAREADVLINQEKIHVAQDAAACVYTLVPNNLTMSAAGGPGTININTLPGCSWNGVSDAPWITIMGAASGTGNGAISFSAASNGGALRVGTMTVAGASATINQSSSTAPGPAPTPSPNPNPTPTPNPNPTPSPNPNPTPTPNPNPSPTPPPVSCVFTLNRTNLNFKKNPGTKPQNVNVTASVQTCSYTANTPDSWLTVVSGGSYTGDATVSISASVHQGGGHRTGTVMIAGQTVTVTQ